MNARSHCASTRSHHVPTRASLIPTRTCSTLTHTRQATYAHEKAQTRSTLPLHARVTPSAYPHVVQKNARTTLCFYMRQPHPYTSKLRIDTHASRPTCTHKGPHARTPFLNVYTLPSHARSLYSSRRYALHTRTTSYAHALCRNCNNHLTCPTRTHHSLHAHTTHIRTLHNKYTGEPRTDTHASRPVCTRKGSARTINLSAHNLPSHARSLKSRTRYALHTGTTSYAQALYINCYNH